MEAVAVDNGLSFEDEIFECMNREEPPVFPSIGDFEQLESQASKLDGDPNDLDSEIWKMAAGEESDMIDLTERKGLQSLDNFLSEVFDGALAQEVWK